MTNVTVSLHPQILTMATELCEAKFMGKSTLVSQLIREAYEQHNLETTKRQFEIAKHTPKPPQKTKAERFAEGNAKAAVREASRLWTQKELANGPAYPGGWIGRPDYHSIKHFKPVYVTDDGEVTRDPALATQDKARTALGSEVIRFFYENLDQGTGWFGVYHKNPKKPFDTN